jgi:elongation factor G
MIISGMSEQHLEMIVGRLRHDFKVDTYVGKPQVAYRETIRYSVEQEGKFVRQTGGRGQYGHVWLTLEPLPRDGGFEFVDGTKDGTVPRQYIPAVEQGVREALEGGVLAGYPMVDVKATITHGSYHGVDSSEVAFKIAGAMAAKEGASKARPIILEPIMVVEVVAPEEFMGQVAGDINSRRGRIHGVDARPGAQVLTAQVPLAQMFGYATELRSMTQGRATYTMKFAGYVEVLPPSEPDGNEPTSTALRVA